MRSSDLFDVQDLAMNETIHLVNQETLADLPIDSRKIAAETEQNPVLKLVRKNIMDEWPAKVS